MNKKISLGITFLLFLCLSVFSACDDDDDEKAAKPTIELEELGSGHDSPNDRIGYIGSEMHIEAIITAEGVIKEIEVEVHQEDGDYEFSKVYTDSKYAGTKNTTFHEHFDIPSEAPAGDYHLHLTVTDQLGQTTTVESELEIKVASGE